MNPNAIDAALYTKLAGGTALTNLLGGTAIYQYLAPENTDAPYVIYQRMSQIPEYVLSGVAMEDAIYMVKGVTEGPSAVIAGSVASAIDTLLQDQALTITGYAHLYLRRESSVDYTEMTEGVRYSHRGATYRIIGSPS
ncbi:MAG: DUF3168 domain-containing protein [Bacteroidales bacterium]|nr:DUF3168 domain-containing protein [Bacteroidales bacterium]